MNEKIKFFIIGFLVCLLAGAAGAGFVWHRQGHGTVGGLDSRYFEEHGGAAETIGRLESELERERGINRQLREHNSRARDIAGGLAGATEQDVRNLQEAVGLIREIRKKLKILADFYADSGSGGGGAGGVGGD